MEQQSSPGRTPPRFPRRKSPYPKKLTYHALHRSLAGIPGKRGPFATEHGWPFFIIDAPGREISVRLMKEDNKQIFLIRESFGPGIKPKLHKCVGRDWMRLKLQVLLKG